VVASDSRTAAAFASSWNNLPPGSVYTARQFEDWMAPLTRSDLCRKRVLELGCGNGSLLLHAASWQPAYLEGVDLGASTKSATDNMRAAAFTAWRVVQGDLIEYCSRGFDVVYCMGVLHHLQEPKRGMDAVIRNTAPGGRFHCWVYGREGNRLVVSLLEPIRRVTWRLPWWLTKYAIATPLVVPFFLYAKALRALSGLVPARLLPLLPLSAYSMWISQREFAFFRHVAFDQLVAPHTLYLRRETIESWLAGYPEVDPISIYVICRNGNSWKFGGRRLPGGLA
jgi:SAM-dependent methyltransferase